MKAADELAAYVGVKPACAALEVSRSMFYRHRSPTTGHQRPRPTPARALSEKERDEVYDTLCSDRFVDRASVKADLRAIGGANELTAGIETFLFHDDFPVDIRHNAKIDRVKLGAWAGDQIA